METSLPKISITVGILFTILGSSFGQSTSPHQMAKQFLVNWKKTGIIEETQLLQIKQLDKNGLPILSEFIGEPELASMAEFAMNEIDAFGAARYLIQNLPRRDPSIHRDAFRTANRLIREYELFVAAGRPKSDPLNAPPRWPTNDKPYPFTRQLHMAAMQLAFADETRDTQAEIVQTIGLTGSRRDIPLLKKLSQRYEYLGWLCVASEARLGDQAACDSIAADLMKPVGSRLAEPVYTDKGTKIEPTPGVKVVSLQDGIRVRTAATQAAFTMNRRFIPMLLRHIEDPAGQWHGDYGDPTPSRYAMDALSTIVFGKEYSSLSIQDWKRWHDTAKM